MKTLEIELQPPFWRPIIRLYGYAALVDTGAVVPVVSLPRALMIKRFQAKLIKDNVSVGGFGGGNSVGDLYSLNNFYIHKFHFKTLECFVPYKPDKDFPIILSVPLFYHTHYEFRADESKMIINVMDDKLVNNVFLIKDLTQRICVQVNGVMLQC